MKFDKYEISDSAKAGDEKYSYEFKFCNNGKYPVKIVNVKTTCGCTVAKIEKKYYLPGESGKVGGEFVFGDRVGFHEKQISVETDDLGAHIIRLVLKINIPKLIELNPGIAFWQLRDDPIPKKIIFSLDETLAFKGFEYDAKLLDLEYEKDKDKGGYCVLVAPKSTSQPLRQAIKIKTLNSRTGALRFFYIHAIVK